jgi:hypothetical protein
MTAFKTCLPILPKPLIPMRVIRFVLSFSECPAPFWTTLSGNKAVNKFYGVLLNLPLQLGKNIVNVQISQKKKTKSGSATLRTAGFLF